MLKRVIIFFVLLTQASWANVGPGCRNPDIKKKFDRINGFPHGRSGYVVDHICPLSCSGIDAVTNMQYQTVSEGKSKDRWETTPLGCSKLCTSKNSTPTRQVFNCKGANHEE